MTRLFLVAGEASGDLHGGLLARALKETAGDVALEGVGGAEMERAGVRLHHRCEEMAITGIWEVVRHLPRFRRLLRELVERLRADPPDALIPIDYPDFNLRLSARAHELGIPVVYYISPQVWAWRKGRIRQLARLVRRMVVIFPFEEDLYKHAGIPVTYVGHPLVDRVRPEADRERARMQLGLDSGDPLVALLPGSRRSEVERILPILLETRRLLSSRGWNWVVALAPGLAIEDLPAEARGPDAPEFLHAQTHELLAAADLALTASGTATLEAALIGTPMLVVYRMHPLTYHLARRLVHVPHIAMANLLAGERVVPEFLQEQARPELLAPEVARWMDDSSLRERTSEKLRRVAERLGGGGAATRAARVILDEAQRP
jgi:lipid-A-disaccharide synthase